jgi:hypothetical protein
MYLMTGRKIYLLRLLKRTKSVSAAASEIKTIGERLQSTLE